MESRYVIAFFDFLSATLLRRVFCVVLVSCHMGNIIEYDTVTNMSWSVDVRTHAIAQMIEKILSQPWAAAEGQGREVPQFKRQDDCVVSFRVFKLNLGFVADSCSRRTVSNGILEITPHNV